MSRDLLFRLGIWIIRVPQNITRIKYRLSKVTMPNYNQILGYIGTLNPVLSSIEHRIFWPPLPVGRWRTIAVDPMVSQ